MKADLEIIKMAIFSQLAHATRVKANAGYAGEYGDGGASVLEDRVKFYRMGMEGVVPPEWMEDYKRVEASNDPEWNEYVRLKNKFKNI